MEDEVGMIVIVDDMPQLPPLVFACSKTVDVAMFYQHVLSKAFTYYPIDELRSDAGLESFFTLHESKAWYRYLI